MRKHLLLSALTLALPALAMAQKWEPLFNGKNLDGWRHLNGGAEYSVSNGVITGVSRLNTPNTFLATEKLYGNFIFEFDFKIEDGLNSGVQFRSESLPEYNSGRVFGYQFEIDPAKRAWTGGIYDEARRNWLYPLTFNDPARKAFKNNEWNKGRIEAIGSSIRTWVNGVPCADLWDDMTLLGFIALQVHGIGNDTKAEGKTVSWKNLRICTTDVERYRTRVDDAVYQVNAIDNTISPREAREGWQLLWDGKTTEGWRGAKSESFPAKGWVIKDGLLKVVKSGGAESANGGDIITVKKYKNFILRVDFKITAGANSGIKYFVDPGLNKGAGSAIGCEYQILDDEKHPDAKLGKDGNRTLGSVYDLIAAPKSKTVKKNDFNTAQIIVKGNHVEHWLNGVKIVEYDRNTPQWNELVAGSKYKDWPNFGNAADGHILLQDHGDEVSFKNIKIKEL